MNMSQGLSIESSVDVGELTGGEIFMVWAIRHWVGSVLNNVNPESVLVCGCESVSMEGLAKPINMLMSSVLPNSIDLRWATCMMYRGLVPGEKNILHSIYLVQNHWLDKTLQFSKTWLNVSVCSKTLDHISIIANIFGNKNHRFPSRKYNFIPSVPFATNGARVH